MLSTQGCAAHKVYFGTPEGGAGELGETASTRRGGGGGEDDRKRCFLLPWFEFYFLLSQTHYHTLLYQRTILNRKINTGTSLTLKCLRVETERKVKSSTQPPTHTSPNLLQL